MRDRPPASFGVASFLLIMPAALAYCQQKQSDEREPQVETLAAFVQFVQVRHV